MVIVFGFTKKRHPIGGFRMMCAACGGPSVQIGMATRSSFTIFWIPFVPVGSSKELVCARCKTVTKATDLPWKEEVLPERFHEEMMHANQLLAATFAARGGMGMMAYPGPAGYPPGAPLMMMPPPAAPVPGPPAPPPKVQCPRCKGEAGFIKEYSRHYCRKCKEYV